MKKILKSDLFVLFCLLFFMPNGALADDVSLTGDLQTGTYTSTANLLTDGTCTVPAGQDVTFSAYFEVRLKPGFSVAAGGKFKAGIADDDGLSNLCEMTYFGNLDQGPNDDPDGDLVSNFQECAIIGSNPNSYDMDNDDDGLADWWELSYFADLTASSPNVDSDGDGVTDSVEFTIKSDPSVNDLPGPGIHYEYDDMGRIKKIWRIPRQ